MSTLAGEFPRKGSVTRKMFLFDDVMSQSKATAMYIWCITFVSVRHNEAATIIKRVILKKYMQSGCILSKMSW